MAPDPQPLYFLHRINTSEVKNKICIKKIHDIYLTENVRKPNIAKIIIVVNYFCKMLQSRCLTGF